MNAQLRSAKATLRAACQGATTEKLVYMLAAAQDGEMPYMNTCKCFVARIGATSFIETSWDHPDWEEAYYCLGWTGPINRHAEGWDTLRYRRIIPILRAQLRIRGRVRERFQERIERAAEVMA